MTIAPRSLAACLATCGLTVAAHAGSVFPDGLESAPDVFSSGISISYDAGTGAFNATGYATLYDDGVDAAAYIHPDSTFDIDAVIDDSGNGVSGSLSISGDIGPGPGSGSLTGDLDSFFFDGGSVFEFQFSVTGGALADDHGGPGALIGVILTDNGTSFTGWDQDFSSSYTGVSDTGIPTHLGEKGPAACAADCNGDGLVNIDDLIAVVLAWGTADSTADANGDGTVDIGDVVVVTLGWGTCP